MQGRSAAQVHRCEAVATAANSAGAGTSMATHTPHDLVFVVGCPRSGTSALAWALAEHPAMATGPETNFLYHLFCENRARLAWERAWAVENGWLRTQQIGWEEFAAAAGAGLAQLFAARAEGRRWVDSSPENVLIAEQLGALFPAARFVHLVRDGREVVASMLHSGFREPWATDFDLACRTWAVYVEAGRRAQAVLGTRMLTVDHGRLVAAPARTCRDILDFLGVGQHPGPARFLASRRINSSYDNATPADIMREKAPDSLRQCHWRDWTAGQHARFAAAAAEVLEWVEALRSKS